MSYNYKEIESVIYICAIRDKCRLSVQRLANLKMSDVWAICRNKYKAHINPRQIKGIKYSDSLTQQYPSLPLTWCWLGPLAVTASHFSLGEKPQIPHGRNVKPIYAKNIYIFYFSLLYVVVHLSC